MYAAAQRWRDESMIHDRSLFDGRTLDVDQAASDLLEWYVNNLDLGSGTFVNKLQTQLADVGEDAVQVAAELLYVHALIASTSTWSAAKKAELVSAVTGFRTTGVASMPDDLRAALAGGAAGTGQGYLNYRWKMFAYLVHVFQTIKQLPVSDRREAFGSLDEFRSALANVDTQSVWAQQYALEHLLFPDDAPAVLSRDDRKAITDAFPERGTDIIQVSQHLERNVTYDGKSFVDPYLHPYRRVWNPHEAETRYGQWASLILEAFDLDKRERAYKLEQAPKFRAALREASDGRNPYDPLRAALRGFNVVDYRVSDPFLTWVAANTDDAINALRELQRDPGPGSIDRFLSYISTSDLPGPGARLNIASTLLLGCDAENLPPWRDTAARATRRLTGGSHPEASATSGEIYLGFLERLDTILDVVNRPTAVHLRDRLDAQGLAWTIASPDLNPPGWSEEQNQAFVSWQKGRGTAPATAPSEPMERNSGDHDDEQATADGSAFEALVNGLSFDDLGAQWLEETLILLQRKQQIILQGPPGTGKTFMAKQIAHYLAGTPDRATITQFHPGTSYEDFIQGLRPDATKPSEFTLVDGPLVKIARNALRNPTHTYVLLIDEINRGNIPAIFGELYFLLEYRSTPVTLLYGEQFALPDNLMIIGTMNTADRSITSLDSALRRRFYIRDLRPDEPPVDGMLRRYLADNAPHLAWLADLLDAANARIDDPDQYIGPSHFMGDIDEAWARRAWSYSVMPTLRELYYSNPQRADAFEFDILHEIITGHGTDAEPA